MQHKQFSSHSPVTSYPAVRLLMYVASYMLKPSTNVILLDHTLRLTLWNSFYCLTIVPCKKTSLHYSLGPGILTWTSTLKSLFTYHSNLSWTPPTPYLTHEYHTQIPIKILDSSYLRTYAGTNTTKPSLHVLTKCWG